MLKRIQGVIYQVTIERKIHKNQQSLKQILNPKLISVIDPILVLSIGPFLMLKSSNSGEGTIHVPNTCQVNIAQLQKYTPDNLSRIVQTEHM